MATKAGGFSVSVLMSWMAGTLRPTAWKLRGIHTTTRATARATTAMIRAGQRRPTAARPMPTRASTATPAAAKADARRTLKLAATPHQLHRCPKPARASASALASARARLARVTTVVTMPAAYPRAAGVC